MPACTSDGGSTNTLSENLFARGTVPPEWDRSVTRPASESVASQSRSTCAFHKGAMPAETIGADLPVDADIPIKNIVVLMQENRSFDSYFGHLGKYAHRTDIESAPDGATNPENVKDPNSPLHAWTHAKTLCLSDTNHEWDGAHLEYDNGKMDGFFQANQGFTEAGEPAVGPDLTTGDRALWWYDERDIPFYYELANTFAIGDHYHSALLGPTYPNRDYLYAATSRGLTINVQPDLTDLQFPAHDAVIFDELERRHISWTVFIDSTSPGVGVFLGNQLVTRWSGIHFEPRLSFTLRSRLGTLPQVSFVDADLKHENVDGNDEHPPSDIQIGQKFVSDVVHDVFKSPQWKDIAMFIAYDEHGGIYDHVPPPPACPPDDLAPKLTTLANMSYPGAFDRLGVRVPVIVVSPYTKRNYVSHHVYDHTSITRFIEAKFKLPALTNRDANADAMFDFFDFSHREFETPPTIADAQIDAARKAECEALYPAN